MAKSKTKSSGDASKEQLKQAKREAKIRIRDFIKSLEDDHQLKADLLLVVGVGRVGRKSTVASMNMQIKDALIEAGEQGLTEMDIFKQFKIGRPEMNRKVRLFLKVADPDSRVWVSFKDGVYRVEALGANPPEEWGGYLPSDVEQL